MSVSGSDPAKSTLLTLMLMKHSLRSNSGLNSINIAWLAPPTGLQPQSKVKLIKVVDPLTV